MEIIDVFNGDADGICALLQMRLADPHKSTLVTGVKRDIQLLRKVQASAGDRVNVFDISMEKNHSDLIRLLDQGVHLFYVDHHRSGEIPVHPGLETIIDMRSETCTSLLINQYLGGEYLAWAITAAFGDNMNNIANTLCQEQYYTSVRTEQLKMLGVCLNYNGYGETVDDLHMTPDRLFLALLDYPDPVDFINDPDSCYQLLHAGYHDDLGKAEQIDPVFRSELVEIFILPDEPWSRRVSGVFGNQLTNESPAKAHAVFTLNQQGGYVVSVRAPLVNRVGADKLCSQFPSGGGRQAAAGINHLPQCEFDNFVTAMQQMYK
ncbi:MAG: DHH family phosphoesterase [Sedimenticola thiotaurini]|uniref:DHH family phosphoesterase n=1 Tax=Sedimenticola thiotaurini TaxID=1543721 RepID=A0A558CU51_9GAMM|nr:MAG: DHH family phosphoesterase [Sedimenticola thiotaurini]